MTWDTLEEFITKDLLPNFAQDYKGSQEEYLRSLLSVVDKCGPVAPSCDLLASILKDSFSTPPLPFDEAWLQYNDPPDDVTLSEFDFLKLTILFQIADLRKMADKGQINDQAFFGVISPTGNDWYNFHPYSVFECAVAGGGANGECSWATLADILETGRIYE